MAGYELIVRRSVATDLRAIPGKDLQRILARIAALATDPRPPGREKLSGRGRYRLRQGRYRILYEIEDARLVVTVVEVGHPRDVSRTR
jgi:mRNA interferase RelE/StbE